MAPSLFGQRCPDYRRVPVAFAEAYCRIAERPVSIVAEGRGRISLISFTAPLWLWNAQKGSWHFITVPEQQSLQIRAESFGSRGGFGSVPVEACIAGVSWRTSLFPQKQGGYILPVKAEVRRRTRLGAGDIATVGLNLI
jgi:hypothetical protein